MCLLDFPQSKQYLIMVFSFYFFHPRPRMNQGKFSHYILLQGNLTVQQEEKNPGRNATTCKIPQRCKQWRFILDGIWVLLWLHLIIFTLVHSFLAAQTLSCKSPAERNKWDLWTSLFRWVNRSTLISLALDSDATRGHCKHLWNYLTFPHTVIPRNLSQISIFIYLYWKFC